jgi:hypothetical protein
MDKKKYYQVRLLDRVAVFLGWMRNGKKIWRILYVETNKWYIKTSWKLGKHIFYA